MLSKEQITSVIKVFEPYLPKKIGIFGSTARNMETISSDIDIMYSLQRPISLFTVARIQIILQEKLGKKVDLVSEEAIHPKLKKYIAKDLKLIYAK